MIGHAGSIEEAVSELAKASLAGDPITAWELTAEEYYQLKSSPRALSYFYWNHEQHFETILGLPYKVINNAQRT